MSLEETIKEAFAVVCDGDSTRMDHKDKLCSYVPAEHVGRVVHGIMRAVVCARHYAAGGPHRFVQKFSKVSDNDAPIPDTHIISPCHPSKGSMECRHGVCEYVIAHSIYLWVCTKLGTVATGEEIGVGCNFTHTADRKGTSKNLTDMASPAFTNARAYELRKEVFSILDKNYGNHDIISCQPVIVIKIVQRFYNEVVRELIEYNPQLTGAIFSRDITAGTTIYARIYKSKDPDLFPVVVKVEGETDRTQTIREETQQKKVDADDRTVFPDIAKVKNAVRKGRSLHIDED